VRHSAQRADPCLRRRSSMRSQSFLRSNISLLQHGDLPPTTITDCSYIDIAPEDFEARRSKEQRGCQPRPDRTLL
jgi:hypothetical protein